MNCSLSHGVTTGFQHCHSLGAEVEFGGLGAEWTITQNNELCWNNTSTNTVSNESTVPGGSAVRLSLFRLAVIVDVTTKITYYRVSTIDTSNCEQPAKPPVYILTSTCETVYEESQTTMWTYQIESEAIACPCP